MDTRKIDETGTGITLAPDFNNLQDTETAEQLRLLIEDARARDVFPR